MPRRTRQRRSRRRQSRRRLRRRQRGGRSNCDVEALARTIREVNEQIAHWQGINPNLRQQIQDFIDERLYDFSILNIRQEGDIHLYGQQLDNVKSAAFELCKVLADCVRNPETRLENRRFVMDTLRDSGLIPIPFIMGAPLPGVNGGPANGGPANGGPANLNTARILQFGNADADGKEDEDNLSSISGNGSPRNV